MKKVTTTTVVHRLHKAGLLNTNLCDIIASKDYGLLEIILKEGLTDVNTTMYNNIQGIEESSGVANWLEKVIPTDVAQYIHRISPLGLAVCMRYKQAIKLLEKFGAQYVVKMHYCCDEEAFIFGIPEPTEMVDISSKDIVKILTLDTEKRESFLGELWDKAGIDGTKYFYYRNHRSKQ